MNISRTYKIYLFLITSIIHNACIDEFEPQKTDEFESALVVDATITNEMKLHETSLSRAVELNNDTPNPERNAEVKLVDDNNLEYNFTESSPGIYRSTIAFNVLPNREYRLSIRTNAGRTYESEWVKFAEVSELDSLYAERIVTDLGEEGMGIFINSFDPSGNSKFYRYEYEETYKIIAPFWVPRDLKFVRGTGFIFVPRPNEEEVCYTTDLSSNIKTTNTRGFEKDELNNFLVRFINRQNYILSHRYSILVRQYVHSEQANSYYETLEALSVSESLLSETQPGFLVGNVFSIDNPSEKVIGYFEVASVSEKRIFFNYEDYFSGERLPEYVSSCQENKPLLGVLFGQLEINSIKFFNENANPQLGEGPYITMKRVCGDCTVLGSPNFPEFWIE